MKGFGGQVAGRRILGSVKVLRCGRLLALLLGLGGCLLPPAFPQGATRPLSLEEAMEIALARSPLLAASLEARREAEARWAESRSSLGPSLTAGGELMVTDNPLAAFGSLLKQGAISPDMDFNEPGTVDHANVFLEGRYRLYDGSGRKNRAEAAKAMMYAARFKWAEQRSALIAKVAAAYRRAQVARSWVQVAEARKEATEESLEQIQERVAVGAAELMELMRVRLEDSEASDQLGEARMQQRVSDLALSFVVGVEASGSFQLEELTHRAAQGEAQPEAYSLNKDNVPSWREARAAVEAAEGELSALRSERQPVVDAFARMDYDDSLDLDRGRGSWMAGARVGVDLWRSGGLDARVAAAEAALHRRQAMLRQVDLSLGTEYELAKERWLRAQERLGLKEEARLVAQEWERLARLRWDEGVYTTADFLEAQQRRYAAEAQKLAAVAETLVAETELRRASGQLSMEGEMDER